MALFISHRCVCRNVADSELCVLFKSNFISSAFDTVHILSALCGCNLMSEVEVEFGCAKAWDYVWKTELADKPVWTHVNGPRVKDLIDVKPGNKYGISRTY